LTYVDFTKQNDDELFCILLGVAYRPSYTVTAMHFVNLLILKKRMSEYEKTRTMGLLGNEK